MSDITGTGSFSVLNPLSNSFTSDAGNNASFKSFAPRNIAIVMSLDLITPLGAWNGSWGGIIAVMCNGVTTISGSLDAKGYGYRGGLVLDHTLLNLILVRGL